jgi:hypothetical protein
LPSGDIHCVVSRGWLRCDALNFTYQRPPRPRSCDLDYGGAVTLGPLGAPELICHADTVANPAAPVLGYGQAWQITGLTCTATQLVLRCMNGEGRGFEMARARLVLF